MKVYILVDNPPREFGDVRIVSVHTQKKIANLMLSKKRKRDEYRWQYLEVVAKKLEN